MYEALREVTSKPAYTPLASNVKNPIENHATDENREKSFFFCVIFCIYSVHQSMVYFTIKAVQSNACENGLIIAIKNSSIS